MSATGPAPAVSVRALCKSYGSTVALRQVTLSAWRGECLGLLGRNGAGKTTLLEILMGLLPSTSGDVRVLGLSWSDSAGPLRERVGLALQYTALPERLRVAETLRLFRSFYPRGRDVGPLAAELELDQLARQPVGALSGGQRQRLALACALVGDPELLVLDEPTTGLDALSRRRLWDVVRAFRARGGTVLLSTHDLDEAELACDRVAILESGRLAAVGAPAELVRALGGEHMIEVAACGPQGEPPAGGDVAGVPGVASAWGLDNGLLLATPSPEATLPALRGRLEQRGYSVAAADVRRARLRDAFVALARPAQGAA